MGGFFESSKNVTLKGAVLVAQCLGNDQQFHDSEIDLNAILGNNNDSFAFPEGEAFKSAQHPRLNFQFLDATLPNDSHIGLFASVNLDEYISPRLMIQ